MIVEVYCDGSSEGNSTGKGGWGYVIVKDQVKYAEGSGHLARATNNIAEMQAAISALNFVGGDAGLVGATEIVLISDSQLVLKFATGEYKCKKFHLVPLYIQLRKLHDVMKIKTRWVRGHAGDIYNEQCDKLAKAAKELPQI